MRGGPSRVADGRERAEERGSEYVMDSRIVGIGGTLRAQSSSQAALRASLRAAEQRGATIVSFDGPRLAQLPMYHYGAADDHPVAQELIAALRSCDGVVVASPGYHGTLSGMLKNALDYVEDLRDDERPYLSGRAVGCVAVAHGWQAAVTTVGSLRDVAHALRGWPTPLGAAVNSSVATFGEDGACSDEKAATQLALVGEQVVDFAEAWTASHRRR